MIVKIKNSLRGDIDKIEDILCDLGCTKIKYIKDRVCFGRDEDSSGVANMVYVETLVYKSFSRSKRGDIITLVSEIKNIGLGEAIRWLAKRLGIEFEAKEKVNVKLPFGGFFKGYEKVKASNDIPLKTYPESVLDSYRFGSSKIWIDEGISALTQEAFSVGYDCVSNRIVFPWRDCHGEVIGLIGRTNKTILNDDERKFKYFPLIAFDKGKALYGLYENYRGVLKSEVIVIVESEKSVLKAREMGYNCVVAIGCNHLSESQIKIIKSFCCNVIICLDEGINIEHSISLAKMCKIKNPFFSNEVYVVDTEGLPEKSCVFDLEEESIVEDYIKNKIIFVE